MQKTWNVIKSVFAVACSLLTAGFALLLCNSPVFSSGESYKLYLGESSTAPFVSSRNPLLDKFALNVRGESVRYLGNRYEQLKEKFHAELLFTETVCGVENRYLYSSLLGDTVTVNGYAVNLHVAVSAEQTAVGTPLIFGGF